MLNERKLTKSELAKREDIIMKMKDNKRALVQKYGKDAEAVMYGRATNLAKTKAEGMDQDKIKELVKDALQNPKKADLNKDGKLSDYEEKRGAAIEKSIAVDELDATEKAASDKIGRGEEFTDDDAAAVADKMPKIGKDKEFKLMEDEDLDEDLDLGHEDNEPHMLKADLYRIGKYAMELYQMVDRFEEGSEEVDFPHWWQSKIIKSKDMLVSAKHYLDFEIKEPQIDAMVDVAAEEDVIDEPLKEGVWSLGSVNDIKKAIQTMEMGLDMDDTELEQHLQDNDAYFYNVLGDDELHDPLSRAYDQAAMGNEDRAHNELADAIGRAYDLLAMQSEKEQSSSKPYPTDIFNEDIDKVELPSTTAAKANTAITTAPTMAKVLLKMYNQLQSKEQTDFSKNADLRIVLQKLEKLASQVSESTLNEEDPGEADMVASDIQKAMNAVKGDESKTHQLKQARTAMNKGDLGKAKKIADRIAKQLKSK
jgi:hypothetical protein